MFWQVGLVMPLGVCLVMAAGSNSKYVLVELETDDWVMLPYDEHVIG